MLVETTRKARAGPRIPLLFMVGLFFFVLLLVLSWAGTRSDPAGNTISEDVVAPAGGKQVSNGSSNLVNASAGQVSVGLSDSSSGSQLYHGVHRPAVAYPRVHDWQKF